MNRLPGDRREILATGIAIAAFTALLVLSLFELVETQRTLVAGNDENRLWTIVQAQSELQKLVIATATEQDVETRQLRFDIALSRFDLLQWGSVARRLPPEGIPIVEKARADLMSLEADIAAPGADIGERANALLSPSIEALRDLANAVMVQENNRSGARREMFRNGVVRVIIFTFGVMACGLFLITRLLSNLQKLTNADEKLRKEKDFLQLLIEASGDGIVAFDKDFNCTHWNSGNALIYGKPAEAVIGRNLFDVFPFPDDHDVSIMLRKTVNGESQRMAEHLLPGSDRFLEKYGFPVQSDGIVIGGVIITRDVTQRHLTHLELVGHRTRLEELVTERTTTLNQTERQLRSAIQSAPDGFAAFDASGALIVANEQASLLVKDEKASFQPGTPLSQVLANVGLAERLHSGSPVEPGADMRIETTELKIEDGSWLLVTLRQAADGTSVLRFADITAYKRAAETLANALAHEQHLRQLHTDFVSMVSHQFRTPLAIIDSGAQRMARRAGEMMPEEIETRTSKIRAAAIRLAGLVQATLDAARMDAGQMDFRPQDCNLSQLVRDVCDRQNELNPNRAFSINLENLPETIHCDPMLMDQVIENMISNALKYSPAETQIDIRGTVLSGQAALTVSDRGVGIPADEIPKLFNRFFRASTATGVEGTGIGLHVARQIALLHGGNITIESVVGRGTSAILTLPVDAHPAEVLQ